MARLLTVIFSYIILWEMHNFPTVFCKCPQFMALSGISQSGNITSPGWPSPYPPDAICAYKLQGEAWQGVKITFHYFDLEPPYSAGCLNDYLELNTVDTKGQRTFRGRYCGKTTPAPILVLHPVVELVFRSNHAAHHDGFAASYEFVDEANVQAPGLNGTSPCGSVIQGIGGLITSPGYPRGYAAGLDCLWLVRAQYNHVIYLRIQHLEFQGSTANCQKAQLRIYDGYEHSLEEHAVLKKFCGDTRFYKAEDDKFILSDRNRLLIRFTTTEPSKPVNDTMTHVGFQLVWSDVEYLSPENCTKSSRFACQETQVCLTQYKQGSSCPELKNYCISSQLVCDGLSNCGEFDSSDERNCSKTPLVITVVAAPLAILTTCLFLCFLCYKRNNRERVKRERRISALNASSTKGKGISSENGGCCCCSKLCCCCRERKASEKEDTIEEKCRPAGFGMGNEVAPITRGPIYFKNDLESPAASDIVSPASGFSDTESEMGGNNQGPTGVYCPAHGPVHFVPMRYLSRHFPLLPVVQEGASYPHQELYDEGGSIYSTSQNSDMVIYEDKGMDPSGQLQHQHQQGMNGGESNGMGNLNIPGKQSSLGFVQDWRLKGMQRRVQRSDAIYMSDDNKSSVASSPGRICPRCLEKERMTFLTETGNINVNVTSGSLLEKQGSGAQFDSGIDVVDSISVEPVKNVSFETCTSDDSAISGFNSYRGKLFGGWKDKFQPPPMVEEVTQTEPHNGESNDVFCETVTTFGVKGEQQMSTKAKATDV